MGYNNDSARISPQSLVVLNIFFKLSIYIRIMIVSLEEVGILSLLWFRCVNLNK